MFVEKLGQKLLNKRQVHITCSIESEAVVQMKAMKRIRDVGNSNKEIYSKMNVE